MKGTGVVFPQFLGIDENGDNVWRLADGRWTWGDDPYDAASRTRTFAPDRYVEKYGAPRSLADLPHRLRTLRPGSVNPSPVQAEDPPVLFGTEDVQAATAEAFRDGKKRGAEEALRTLLETLDGWIEGARSNHDGFSHRGEPIGEECWTQYAPADIRRMINDAAREVGVAEFSAPKTPKEDEIR